MFINIPLNWHTVLDLAGCIAVIMIALRVFRPTPLEHCLHHLNGNRPIEACKVAALIYDERSGFLSKPRLQREMLRLEKEGLVVITMHEGKNCYMLTTHGMHEALKEMATLQAAPKAA